MHGDGQRLDTHTVSPSGVTLTCRFIPRWRCLPEQNSWSAVTRSMGIKAPSMTS